MLRRVATTAAGLVLAVGGVLVIQQAGAGPAPTWGTAAAAAPADGAAKAPGDGSAAGEGTASWASARAKATGREVAVVTEQAERRDVYAQPDGTFRATLWTKPVRARVGGAWMPIDTTLRVRADGSVGAAATEVPVVFSGGGDRPMVRLGDGTEQVTLRWPAALPKPAVDGDTATYPEILPGVDLRLTATESGFRKVFVVKDRAAAANPDLAALRLGVTVKGATLRDDGHGNIGAFNGTDQVFAAGAAQMWDSTPGTAHQALSGVRVEDKDIVLRPNRALLDAADTTYPVYIDPGFNAGRTGFTTVVSGSPNGAYWGGHDGTLAKVGDCDWPGCNGIGVARSFFVFDVRPMSGKTILSGEFNAFLDYSPSCSARVVVAQSTTRATTATTWHNMPTLIGNLTTQNVAAGYNSSCPARWLGFNAKRAAGDGLARNGGYATIMLRANNESDAYGWKKFRSNPSLEFVYNTRPNPPTSMSAEGKACAVAPNEPYVNPFVDGDPNKGKRGPRLAARAVDPDGGTVKVEFAWFNRGGAQIGTASTGYKASNSTFTLDVPAAVVGDFKQLSYQARAYDGTEYGLWGAKCDVTVDRIAPTTTPTITSTDYPRCVDPEEDPDNPNPPCPVSGAVGRTGTFKVTVGAGDTDIAGYRYGLVQSALTYFPAGSGGVTNIPVTPDDDGSLFLYVRPVDKAGNLGPQATYHFHVGAGTPPVGQWQLDGITERTALDDSPNNHDGPVTLGPTTWKLGRHGDALWFNGTSAAFVDTTNGPTVHTNTTFAVSAWVKLDTLDSTFRTAVAQDGGKLSGFYLQYNGNTKRWNFVMTPSDTAGATRSAAQSKQSAIAGRWTHLVGVYDAGARQVKIYVDGLLGDAAALATSWDAGGTVQLGRAKAESGYTNFWLGSIDEVRIYDRALSADEIPALAGRPATEELFLPLDEGSGSTVTDASGGYRIGTVGSAGSWTDGRADPDGNPGKALAFNGGSGVLPFPGPVVRTDASFTSTAWVQLAAADSTWRTVLSQDGTRASGFELGYRGDTGRWTFRLPQADTDNPAVTSADDPNGAQSGEWTHLAGVYDQAAAEIRLYVNGALAGRTAATSTWNSAGPFQVGRGKKAGAVFAPFAGVVEDVHVWTGVRTQDQILADKDSTVTRRETVYSGQIGRFYNVGQYHVVTNGPVPIGSHFEFSYGVPAPEGTENTQTVYSCRRGATDYLLALACGSDTTLGVVGQFYVTPPAGVPTIPLYRCLVTGRAHFVSSDPACEGQVMEALLGYTRAYSNLVRSAATNSPYDRASTTYRAPAQYRADSNLGMVAINQVAGSTALLSCQTAEDTYSSTDPACEGGTVLRRIGFVWSAPPTDLGVSTELFRCRTVAGDRFDSTDPGCEGGTRDRSLGFVVTQL